MIQDDLLKSLKEIADKFLLKAKTDSSTKVVLASLQIVETTIRLAERYQRIPQANYALTEYLEKTQEKMLKTDFYQCYIAHCIARGEESLPKKALLEIALKVGFQEKKSGGYICIYPPNYRRLRIEQREAAKQSQ